MGLLNMIEGAICDAQISAEARKFAAKVQVGDVWYSVETYKQPWGDSEMLKEHHFTKKCKLTGQAMCGHRTAAAVWRAHGPLYLQRPAGYQTEDEYSESGSWEINGLAEEVASRSGWGARKRAKAGVR
ncbi:hypothetical protein [Streptomyces sp. NPDC001404]|uniref:hypothetical protein n=1 Tax=Streptomyces sp. NPDC001404 TaxID=3364571 RepID=UPI00368BBDC0